MQRRSETNCRMQVSNTAQERLLLVLGERLRDLRKSQCLRQIDMQDFGLNHKYYQRLESGQVNPTLLTLQKVATALKVSVADLFTSDCTRYR